MQTQEPIHGQALVRAGRHDITVHPGQVACIKCKVSADFIPPEVLFEVSHSGLRLEQLDLGDGLVVVHHTRWPYVEIPVCNHTKYDITLDNFTVLSSIQKIDKMVETDQTDSIEVNLPAPVSGDDKTRQLSQLWHPHRFRPFKR